MASPVLHVTLSKSAIDASIAFLGPFSIDRRRVLGRAFFCILFILLCGPLLLCNSPPPVRSWRRATNGNKSRTDNKRDPPYYPLVTPPLDPHRNDCNEIDDRRVVRGETKQTTTTTKPKRKETPQKQSVVGFVCVLFFCLFVFAFFFLRAVRSRRRQSREPARHRVVAGPARRHQDDDDDQSAARTTHLQRNDAGQSGSSTSNTTHTKHSIDILNTSR